MLNVLLQVIYGFLSFQVPAAPGDGLTVTTHQGAVVGTLINPTTRQFLGIPYASNTYPYRFLPPQPPLNRTQPLDASYWGDSCPMELSSSAKAFLSFAGFLKQQENVPVSENCLNLNIWAPAVNRKQSTAVMIWVYGGSGRFGTINTSVYNGSYFVNHYNDITIVSINYRLNIFGFPNAPGTVNVGLLDIEAAIKWVYANIAKFGGDPERITLFGESFGSMAVDAYTYSHYTDTIVKGIIMESGLVFLDKYLAPNNTAWDVTAAKLGCNAGSLQFLCMQQLPWQTIEKAIIDTGVGFSAGIDGQTIYSDWNKRLQDGPFLQVPTMIGNNANEGDMFVQVFLATGGKLPRGVSFDDASAAVTDVLFHCPAADSAYERVRAKVATYRYIYYGIFDNITNKTANLRAFHTAEIPLVFNTYNLSSFNYSSTATEVALGKVMQGAWVAFAQDPSNGLVNYGWKRYSTRDLFPPPTIAILGDPARNASGVVFDTRGDHDDMCSALEDVIPIAEAIVEHIGHII